MNDRAQFQKDHPWARVANSDTSGLAALGKVGEALLRKARYSNPAHESEVRDSLLKSVALTIAPRGSMPSFRAVSALAEASKTLGIPDTRPAGAYATFKDSGVQCQIISGAGGTYIVRLPSGDLALAGEAAFTPQNLEANMEAKSFGGSFHKSASIPKGGKIKTRDGRIGVVLSDPGNLAVTAKFSTARGDSLEVLLPGEFSPA